MQRCLPLPSRAACAGAWLLRCALLHLLRSATPLACARAWLLCCALQHLLRSATQAACARAWLLRCAVLRLLRSATQFKGRASAEDPCAGYLLALLSWSLFVGVFLVERDRYSPARTWLWRFPLFLILAGQLAKLK